jgi:hypothetical protein
LSPLYGCVISANDATYDSTNPGMQILMRHTYWTQNASISVGQTGALSYLAHFSGNSASVPPPVWVSALGLAYPVCPMVEMDFNNPRLFNTQNPKRITNAKGTQWPWVISPTTNRVVLNKALAAPVDINFWSTPDDLDLLVRVCGTWLTGGGFCSITWGGVNVFSANLGFSNGGNSIQEITIRRPDAQQGIQPIVVEFSDNTVEYESVQLIPVNFQRLAAAPAAVTSSYRVGDMIYNSAPVVAGTFAWVTTTAGVPGSGAVFSPVSMP